VQVLALAHKESIRLGHNFVGTEHVLLGLMALGQGTAVNALTRLGLNLEALRKEIETYVGTGAKPELAGTRPLYTPRLKRALALAQTESKSLKHTFVGTEHILLGLVREGDGIAAKVIQAHGIDLVQLRKEILHELDPNLSPEAMFSPENSKQETSAAPPEPSVHERRKFKIEPVDLGKRYDVYCVEHGESVVYRNVRFKSIKGLLPGRESDYASLYVELEQADGKTVFLPKHSVFKFCDPGASASGERVPPKT
jgi:ATP-dependent Clp protease ATP-binding subunit ClpC